MFVMNDFASLERCMSWADPWHERIWEEPSEADDTRILFSRKRKPTAVGR